MSDHFDEAERLLKNPVGPFPVQMAIAHGLLALTEAVYGLYEDEDDDG